MKSLYSVFIISFLTVNSIFAQHTITGKVTDETGTVLPGVSVLEKGTKNGTMTSGSGMYSITVKSKSAILVFSYIGMQTIEKKITGDTLNITMSASGEELDEIVVTALGRKSRPIFQHKDISRSDYPIYEDSDYGTGRDSKDKNPAKSGLLTAGELNDYGITANGNFGKIFPKINLKHTKPHGK
ncbi:MAG: hypothetical protein GXO80_13535 [Chlorobi bacterium]|nr:hypothetical protein [Chlorobiota bacterium]